MLKKALRATERIPAITAPLFMVLFGLVRILSGETGIESKKLTPRALPKLGLTREVVESLPRYCTYANGKPMESMNVILLGSRAELRSMYALGGWYEALRVSFWSLLRAQLTLIVDAQFLRGPVTPLFVGKKQHDIAFQKPTEINKFKQRHHMRLWKTGQKTPVGQSIWIGQASYDVGIKQAGSLIRVPVHEIAPDLDTEREVLRADLLAAGGIDHGYIRLQAAHDGQNAFHDHFMADGRAFVIEAPRLTKDVQKTS